MHLGFSNFQILVIWGPYDPSVPLAVETQAKNPKTAGAWCGEVNLGAFFLPRSKKEPTISKTF